MSRTMNCHCGTVMTEADTPSLVEPVFLHFDAAHAELELSRVSVRNYLEAEDRATGGVDRLETIGEIEVVEITPGSADEVIDFFDHRATPDNPAWGSCYCMFYFLGGMANPDWGHVPWQESRRQQHDRISSGRTTGALAYVDGAIAGWCNAGARTEYPGRVTGGGDDTTHSVVCFIIAPPYRRHGLATRLLAGVVEMALGHGFMAMEAYPRRDPQTAASSYVGSLDLYADAGFSIIGEDPLTVGLDLNPAVVD